MQLSLAISVVRCRDANRDMAGRLLSGQFEDAALIGRKNLWRDAGRLPALERSQTAQLLSRALLAMGREQEAQEVMVEIRKVYEQLSRNWVRWATSLDQGWLFLSQNRPGRAIECFRVLTEDIDCDVGMRVEGLNCLADALMALGEGGRALSLLSDAQEACDAEGIDDLRKLTQCHRFELLVTIEARQRDELADHALSSSYRSNPGTVDLGQLRRELAAFEAELADRPLIAQRLQHLQLLATCAAGVNGGNRLADCLAWLRDRHLAGLEPSARIESAMALLAGGSHRAAAGLLAGIAQADPGGRQVRYAIDLPYCKSKLLHMQGRMSDSFDAYKSHVEEAVYVMKRDMGQAIQLRDVKGKSPATDSDDAGRLRLPLKYRAAYQYIVEHLSDPSLSVHDIALHLGVTERSLQLVFRTNLGMTPVEFIRKRRMECIRADLISSGARGSKVNVLDVAARWGVNNRSTLAQNYRQVFAETPFETLHGRSGRAGRKGDE